MMAVKNHKIAKIQKYGKEYPCCRRGASCRIFVSNSEYFSVKMKGEYHG